MHVSLSTTVAGIALPSMVVSGDEAGDFAGKRWKIEDPDGALNRTHAPVVVAWDATLGDRKPDVTATAPALREIGPNGSRGALVAGQWLSSEAEDGHVRLAWLLPEGPAGPRVFTVDGPAAAPAALSMTAQRDPHTGQYELREGATPVLRYNYATVEPGEILQQIAPGNRRYAVARSDYIHPLYGPHGEALTKDWPVHHPHHRGIYWAWPEVDWRGQRGDLHALQKVFARPTGRCRVASGPVFAQVEGENLWRWEGREPIVRELAVIRAWRRTKTGRCVDLVFWFEALKDPVWIARRHTDLYGGLNVRLNAVRDQHLVKHTDPPAHRPRRAWGEVSGTFAGADRPAGLVILQHATNPDYPGDWVDYPQLNWLQPTFPKAKTRYRLEPGRPLRLRYRFWIHAGGAASNQACADQWTAAQAAVSPLS